MTNKLLVLLIAAAAGCGVVTKPPGAATGSGSDDRDAGSVPDNHPVGVFFGTMFDERNDAIDFSTGEPVHTHGGPAIDLSAECPSLYKYAYLASSEPPPYGKELSSNPLAWHIDPGITDDSPSAYRVRTSSGATLLDWTPMSPDANGVYNVELHRDGAAGVPKIATTVDTFYLDTRFRVLGDDTVKSACWKNHPLAAPIDFDHATAGELFDFSFASHSPISRLLLPTSSGRVAVANFGFFQQTAEPVTLRFAMPVLPTGVGSNELVDVYEDLYAQPTNIPCGNAPCQWARWNHTSTTGPINGQWELDVLDTATSEQVCGAAVSPNTVLECVIPRRWPNEAPHSYRAVLRLSAETSIAPPTPALTPSSYLEKTVFNYWMTVGAQNDFPQFCSTDSSNPTTGAHVCVEMTTYTHYIALNRAKLDFDSFTLQLGARAGDVTTTLPLAYVTGSATSFSGTWDAGVDGL